MDKGQGNEIWDAENREKALNRKIENIVGEMKEQPKSKIKKFVMNNLRNLLDENNVREEIS